MKALSQISGQLLWPAAAGNVIWSFLSLLIEPGLSLHERTPHLIALSLIGVYLCGNWIRRLRYGDEQLLFLLFDVAHMLGVSVCALAIYYGSLWSDHFLTGFFLLTSTMHLVGAGPTTRARWSTRIIFSSASFLGVVVMFGWHFLPQELHAWNLSAAISSVLIAWSVLLLYFPAPQAST